jgi:parallel beta-helix repeat protein
MTTASEPRQRIECRNTAWLAGIVVLLVGALAVNQADAANCGGATLCSCNDKVTASRTLVPGSDPVTMGSCAGVPALEVEAGVTLGLGGATITGTFLGVALAAGATLNGPGTITGFNRCVIGLTNEDGIVVSGVTVDGCAMFGMDFVSDGNSFTGNTVKNGGAIGIYVVGSGNTLTSNTVQGFSTCFTIQQPDSMPPTTLSSNTAQGCGVGFTISDTMAGTTTNSGTCPADTSVDCGQSTDPAATGSSVGVAVCMSSGPAAHSDSVTPGDCPQGSEITRSWSSSDTCMNQASCDQTIEIVASTPTSTATATATATATVTQTATATPTVTPAVVPAITDDLAPGATRVDGSGAPRPTPNDCIEICLATNRAMPSEPPCTGADVVLGSGGTNASGAFVDGNGELGIPLSAPLAAGQCLYAYDQCAMASGAVVCLAQPAPAPVLSWWGWLGVGAAFLWSAFVALHRSKGAAPAS